MFRVHELSPADPPSMMSYGYLVSSLGGESGTAAKQLRAAIGEKLFADYMNRLNPDTHSDVFKGTSRCYACAAGKKTKDRMKGNLNTELNLLFFSLSVESRV